MNKAWHEANPMPKNATEEQRQEWHEAHARYCGCRDIPASLREKIVKKLPRKRVLGTALDCD